MFSRKKIQADWAEAKYGNTDWNITKFLLQWDTENWEKKPIKQSDWIVVQCTGTLVLHVVQCTGTL